MPRGIYKRKRIKPLKQDKQPDHTLLREVPWGNSGVDQEPYTFSQLRRDLKQAQDELKVHALYHSIIKKLL